MKFWKNLFAIGAVAGVGYLGFKGYQRVSDIIKMSKSLPSYLQDLLDETPKIDINMRLNSLSVAVGLTAETYENLNFDLSEQIISYIDDYYPTLAKLKVSVTKYIKAIGNEEDNGTCDCGCDQEGDGDEQE